MKHRIRFLFASAYLARAACVGVAEVGVAGFGVVGAVLVMFERDGFPRLKENCNECHHREQTGGGLDLTRLPDMLRGGDEQGAAVVPGNYEQGSLTRVLQRTADYFMPEDRLASVMPNSTLALPASAMPAP